MNQRTRSGSSHPTQLDFDDFPRRRPLADYERAVQAYVARARSLEGVRGLYRLGGFSAPGYSDVDILVVVDNRPPATLAAALRTEHLDEAARSLFLHQPFVIPERMIEELGLIIQLDTLVHLEGKTYSLTAPTAEEQRSIDAALALEWNLGLLAGLQRLRARPVLPVRNTAVILHSVAQGVQVAARLGHPSIAGGDDFVGRVRELRGQWFEGGENDPHLPLLVATLDAGIATAARILTAVDSNVAGGDPLRELVLRSTPLVLGWSFDQLLAVLPPDRLPDASRLANVAEELARRSSPWTEHLPHRLARYAQLLVVPVPPVVARELIRRRAVAGAAARNIDRMFGPEISRLAAEVAPLPIDDPTLERRTRLIAAHVEFLKAHGFDYGAPTNATMAGLARVNAGGIRGVLEHVSESLHARGLRRQLDRAGSTRLS